MHPAGLLRHPADHDRRFGSAEGVVVDLNRTARDVGAIPAISPAMDVEAMAQRSPEFDVVSRDVTASSRAGAGNRVAVPIKSIVLNWLGYANWTT